MTGLTYQRLGRPRYDPDRHVWDWRQRVAWLRRHEQYDSGPYEQLANVFRDHGYAAEAEQILIAQRRHRRELGPRLPVLRRLLDRFYDIVVGYGYRPGRVLWALLGLLILVGLSVAVDPGRAALRATDPAGNVYTVQGPLPNPATTDSCGDGRVRCFNPVFYAIDTVIPLVSLDQRTTWHPDRHTRYGTLIEWWLNLATVAGWLLSSIIVLSLTRLARSA